MYAYIWMVEKGGCNKRSAPKRTRLQKVKTHQKATRTAQDEKRLKRTFRTKHGKKSNVCFYNTNQTLLRHMEILNGRFESERCVQDLT